MSKYKFNRDQLSFIEDKPGLLGKFKVFFRYLIVSVLLAILYYIVFALLFNTSEEERLQRENEMLQSEYFRSLEKLDVLDNVITELKIKDREIYMSIFKSTPPEMLSEYNPRLYVQLDTTSDRGLVQLTSSRIMYTEYMAASQVKRIEDIYSALDTLSWLSAVPAIMPVKGLSPSQTGAGIGQKVHPFYKTMNEHTGVDLLASVGAEVVATADGVVTGVVRSDRGRGNQVTIAHNHFYETYYAHLGDILVRNGQRVSRGTVIARVGNSGLSFAPHLHYEVRMNGKVMDPINYFFADLKPGTYREMMITALNSGQSMD